jgi:acyl carrier protein
MADTLQAVKDILVEKFELDPDKITLGSTLEDLGLDSLDTFDMIFSAEEVFKVKVPNDQVDIKTLQDVVNLLDRLVKEQHPA